MRTSGPISKTGACAFALALLAVARSAAGQQCPVAEFGQACSGGNVGVCVQSTCSSTGLDGATTEAPCGFCEPVGCPSTEVGQPCEGGTCTEATCEGTDDAGFATTEPCAMCLMPPPNACPADQVGMPCADGGTCMASDGKADGPAGTPPPSQIVYPIWTCQVVFDGGGVLSAGDAGVTEDGAATSDDLADANGSAPHSNSSSGCAVSAAPTPHGLGLWLFGGVFALALRRRSEPRTSR
jgi:MYXO-CTERM domain-containing protein